MVYSFRHRVGDINWKEISSVNLDDILLKGDVLYLQSVIDSATFSDFKTTDVKSNTAESVCKLVNLMQLMVEYLLHCQEHQNVGIRKIHEKNLILEERNQRLRKIIFSLKEDTRIYQRQLSFLGGSPLALDPDHIERGKALLTESPTDSMAPIVQSILQHEKETRNFLSSLLEDQRARLLSTEMGRILHDTDDGYKHNAADEGLAEHIFKKLDLAIARSMSRVQAETSALAQANDDHIDVSYLRQDVDIKTRRIVELERLLAEDEQRWQAERLALQAEAIKNTNISDKYTEIAAEKSLLLCDINALRKREQQYRADNARKALSSMNRILAQGRKWAQLRVFRRWTTFVRDERDAAESCEHARLLHSAQESMLSTIKREHDRELERLKMTCAELHERCRTLEELLREMPEAQERFDSFPHELQRSPHIKRLELLSTTAPSASSSSAADAFESISAVPTVSSLLQSPHQLQPTIEAANTQSAGASTPSLIPIASLIRDSKVHVDVATETDVSRFEGFDNRKRRNTETTGLIASQLEMRVRLKLDAHLKTIDESVVLNEIAAEINRRQLTIKTT